MDDIDINGGGHSEAPPNAAPPPPPHPQQGHDPFVGLGDGNGAPTKGVQAPAASNEAPIFPVITTQTNDAEFTMSEKDNNNNSEEDVQRKALACVIALSLLSFITMIQSSIECDREHNDISDCDKEYAYAVAVAVVSLVLCGGLLLLYKYKQERAVKVMPYFAIFLTIWWGFGVGVCTFKLPFSITGNGYFALWLGLFTSFYMSTLTVTRFKDLVGRAREKAMAGSEATKCLALIFIFSLAVLIASAVFADEYNGIDSEEATAQENWGIACSSVSLGLVVIWFLLQYLKQNRGMTNPIRPGWFAAFLSVWWLFGVGVLTFDKPFTTTGNGYFATWGAFGTSLYLCYLYFMKIPGGGSGGEQEGVPSNL